MKTITHNGVPCVEARVHRLATEEMTDIFKKEHLNIFHLRKNMYQFDDTDTDLIPLHLYITLDDGINDGDWYLATVFGHGTEEIKPLKWLVGYKPCGEIPMGRKIIATTDPKLTDKCKGCKRVIKGSPNNPPFTDCTCINRIPQSFIEEYCKAGGIDKVLVEVERQTNKGEWKDVLLPSEWGDSNPTRLKTDSNNYTIIHPVEEDKILTALQKFWNSAVIESTVKYSDLDKWIKENL